MLSFGYGMGASRRRCGGEGSWRFEIGDFRVEISEEDCLGRRVAYSLALAMLWRTGPATGGEGGAVESRDFRVEI